MGYNTGAKFEPKPGCGTLFIKNDKRNAQAPDYDGYFIADRDIQSGEKVKLVGWDKTPAGTMINLKVGREQQDIPKPDPRQQADTRQQAYRGYAPTAPNAPQPPPQSRFRLQGPQQQQDYQNQPNPTYGGQPSAPPDRGAPPPAESDLPF